MAEAADLTLRPLGPDDIGALHELSREAAWPHTLYDVRLLADLGSGVAAVDAAGRIVGSAMWWPNGPDHGTVGMVIVTPAMGGRGLGGRLMAAIMAQAGSRRLTLNATAAGRPLYDRLGFVPTGTVRQFQGIVAPPGSEPAGQTRGRVRPLEPNDLPAVIRLDAEASGRDRSAVILRVGADSTGVVHEGEGGINGFAMTRPFGRGFVVGPLLAGSDAVATALLAPSLLAHASYFLRTDTPVTDGPFIRALLDAGLSLVDEPVTMARGGTEAATAGPARIYALASQALG